MGIIWEQSDFDVQENHCGRVPDGDCWSACSRPRRRTGASACAKGNRARRRRELLIGSLHIGDPRLAQPGESILDGADRLVLEDLPGDRVSMSFAMPPASAVGDYLRTGQFAEAAWASSLTPDDRAKLRDRLACLSPGENIDSTLNALLAGASPAPIALFASLPCSQPSRQSRDAMVLAYRQRRGVRLVPLETAIEEQQQMAFGERTVSCQRDLYSAIE